MTTRVCAAAAAAAATLLFSVAAAADEVLDVLATEDLAPLEALFSVYEDGQLDLSKLHYEVCVTPDADPEAPGDYDEGLLNVMLTNRYEPGDGQDYVANAPVETTAFCTELAGYLQTKKDTPKKPPPLTITDIAKPLIDTAKTASLRSYNKQGSVTGTVRNQEKRGTCWAFAAVALLESLLIKKHLDGTVADRALQPFVLAGEKSPQTNFSEELLAYRRAKRVSDAATSKPTFDQQTNDEGGLLADAMKVQDGVFAETKWPYIGHVGPNTKAGGASCRDGARIIGPAAALGDATAVRDTLKKGIPVYFTFNVAEEFMKAGAWTKNPHRFASVKGLVYVPPVGQNLTPLKSAKGGLLHASHAMMLVGVVKFRTPGAKETDLRLTYDFFGGGYFVFKNSWGTASGNDGYFYIPLSYFARQIRDGDKKKMRTTKPGFNTFGDDVKLEPGMKFERLDEINVNAATVIPRGVDAIIELMSENVDNPVPFDFENAVGTP